MGDNKKNFHHFKHNLLAPPLPLPVPYVPNAASSSEPPPSTSDSKHPLLSPRTPPPFKRPPKQKNKKTSKRSAWPCLQILVLTKIEIVFESAGANCEKVPVKNCSGEPKGVVSKRVVLADVPPERKPERGHVRQNHPFGNRPFISQMTLLGVDKRVVSKRVVSADVPPERKPERGHVRQNHPFYETALLSASELLGS